LRKYYPNGTRAKLTEQIGRSISSLSDEKDYLFQIGQIDDNELLFLLPPLMIMKTSNKKMHDPTDYPLIKYWPSTKPGRPLRKTGTVHYFNSNLGMARKFGAASQSSFPKIYDFNPLNHQKMLFGSIRIKVFGYARTLPDPLIEIRALMDWVKTENKLILSLNKDLPKYHIYLCEVAFCWMENK